MIQFAALVKDVPEDKPIFVFKEHAYNSTVNDVLERHCDRAKIPVISVHGLRHTHASVLLFAGVSIASVARRLGAFQHDNHAEKPTCTSFRNWKIRTSTLNAVTLWIKLIK